MIIFIQLKSMCLLIKDINAGAGGGGLAYERGGDTRRLA